MLLILCLAYLSVIAVRRLSFTPPRCWVDNDAGEVYRVLPLLAMQLVGLAGAHPRYTRRLKIQRH